MELVKSVWNSAVFLLPRALVRGPCTAFSLFFFPSIFTRFVSRAGALREGLSPCTWSTEANTSILKFTKLFSSLLLRRYLTNNLSISISFHNSNKTKRCWKQKKTTIGNRRPKILCLAKASNWFLIWSLEKV